MYTPIRPIQASYQAQSRYVIATIAADFTVQNSLFLYYIGIWTILENRQVAKSLKKIPQRILQAYGQ